MFALMDKKLSAKIIRISNIFFTPTHYLHLFMVISHQFVEFSSDKA